MFWSRSNKWRRFSHVSMASCTCLVAVLQLAVESSFGNSNLDSNCVYFNVTACSSWLSNFMSCICGGYISIREEEKVLAWLSFHLITILDSIILLPSSFDFVTFVLWPHLKISVSAEVKGLCNDQWISDNHSSMFLSTKWISSIPSETTFFEEEKLPSHLWQCILWLKCEYHGDTCNEI